MTTNQNTTEEVYRSSSMERSEVILKLGNLIMSSTPYEMTTEDKRVLFEAYKLITNSVQEELNRIAYDDIFSTSAYQEWRDEYVHQMLWFYGTLGLDDAHVDGDFLSFDQNGIFGYDLKKMYKAFTSADDEQ